ncbi:protein UNUSUAL FLORAL ORGANS-like [Selaginella moellendorffii]|uniref:protein UNUSUAL FLORAL ORGANS-like n=1 Tax=Selaginella moellendorffii TaxID=88036 RepID=UPI000D1CCFE4|nr:protein UNUSUAL FLORAL ORGANS-like [Selaginella moellendorffii]|eukprot:XP_024543630.1 protein UNUSUAL FLORAL ORGANS-like [Selaginella moellendorffii]
MVSEAIPSDGEERSQQEAAGVEGEASCSYNLVKKMKKLDRESLKTPIPGGEEEEDDDDQFMDPALWGCLPEDLHDRILARLPIPSFFRLRIVCSRWQSLLSSPTFLGHCAAKNHQSWLLMFADVHYKLVFVYIPDEDRWLHFPLSFLPSNIYYITGAGGLLCFRLVEANGASSMCVCNPITRSWRRLPPLLGDFYAGLVGMVAESEDPRTLKSGRYRIVVRTKPPGSDDFDFTNLRTEVYDSASGHWSISGVPEDDLTMGKAVCNGVLYFMTWEARNGVYAFLVDQGIWININAPWPYFFTCPHLVECAGALFMVGGFGKQHVSTVGIRVWQLRAEAMEWELIDSMPSRLFDEFLTKPGGMYFDCAGNGGCVYFINYEKPPMLIVFDVVRCLWRKLGSPAPNVLHKMFLCFSFTPQLGCPI